MISDISAPPLSGACFHVQFSYSNFAFANTSVKKRDKNVTFLTRKKTKIKT